MKIKDAIARRSDLSTFVVHLTRDFSDSIAKNNLEAIIKKRRIEARSIFGHAKQKLEKQSVLSKSQKAVCFTETPLEYIYLLCQSIEDREIQYEPYGIAFTKKVARDCGINPVWYVDISPSGHDWLAEPINILISKALEGRNNEEKMESFEKSEIAKITPFVEQMGTKRGGYRKEFWWEREWRCQGDFKLPRNVIILCPENEHDYFCKIAKEAKQEARIIDATWGLEQIIAHLAGFTREEIEIFP
jgi:hypothetical protein